MALKEPTTAFYVGGPGNGVEGATLASAATIAPTGYLSHVTGTAEITTITPPFAGCSQLVLIPAAAFTLALGGNIGLASTAVAGKALSLFYAPSSSKWYPSY